MPHIAYPKRKFDPRPGRASTVGPNSVGKVPITRMVPLKENPLPENPAQILADAIREHRDTKWQGGKVTDSLDLRLYDVLVWAETETEDLDSPILET